MKRTITLTRFNEIVETLPSAGNCIHDTYEVIDTESIFDTVIHASNKVSEITEKILKFDKAVVRYGKIKKYFWIFRGDIAIL